MSKKYKKVCTTLSYIKNFLILASTMTGCISISFFFTWYSIRITSSAIELNTSEITVGVKKCQSIIKKKKKTWWNGTVIKIKTKQRRSTNF